MVKSVVKGARCSLWAIHTKDPGPKITNKVGAHTMLPTAVRSLRASGSQVRRYRWCELCENDILTIFFGKTA